MIKKYILALNYSSRLSPAGCQKFRTYFTLLIYIYATIKSTFGRKKMIEGWQMQEMLKFK